MTAHVPYEARGVEPDFLVSYEYIPGNKGTRRLFQGIRCDWSYAEDDPTGISMIWPQFIDSDGKIVADTDDPIADQGIASMWILMPVARAYHRPRIRKGVRGYFVAGPHKIATAVVTEVIGLENVSM